jgi:putative ATP-binding cassette transporter
MPRLNRRLWKRFVSIAWPYWVSDEKWKARILLGLLFLLLLAYTEFTVLNNRVIGDITSALAAQDGDRYWSALRFFLLLLVIAVPINSFYYYVRDLLAISWRRWLTHRFLGDYFANRAYYDLASSEEIDNPDQRIADDINNFTKQSLQFLLVISNNVMQLVAFSIVLWTLSHTLVYFLILYAAAGTGFTVFVFGKMLTKLNYAQIKREADFRFSLVRVRENVETIAFYQGEKREESLVKKFFNDVYKIVRRLIRWQLYLNGFQYFNSYMPYLLPYVILSPAVLAGELEVGNVMQATGAFAAMLIALNLIIDNFDGLTRFAAGIDRLDAFAKFLKAQKTTGADAVESIEFKTGEHLEIDHLTLKTPKGERVLVEDLSVSADLGAGLMIVGPSGCGKTSLLRAIAGLWTSGTGTIVRPNLHDILFLPQRPYLILGNLRSQLLYPRIDSEIADDELRRVLEAVNLERLAKQAGALDEEMDWAKVLSIGEQQRLSFARLLLFKPKIAILDEATSALDAKNEEMLYRQLAGKDTTLISVSHHDSVAKYHRHILELVGDGEWTLHAAGDNAAVRSVD